MATLEQVAWCSCNSLLKTRWDGQKIIFWNLITTYYRNEKLLACHRGPRVLNVYDKYFGSTDCAERQVEKVFLKKNLHFVLVDYYYIIISVSVRKIYWFTNTTTATVLEESLTRKKKPKIVYDKFKNCSRVSLTRTPRPTSKLDTT